jgi:hypothetical protein
MRGLAGASQRTLPPFLVALRDIFPIATIAEYRGMLCHSLARHIDRHVYR